MSHNPAAEWVSYRPEIQIIDCTIRDGGLMNDHHFEDQTVQAVYRACAAGGIDYMEIGYKGSPEFLDPAVFGPWKFSSEDDIKRIAESCGDDVKLSVMADIGRTDPNHIPPADQSPVSLVRVACYIHQVPGALDMAKYAKDQGYRVSINLMALSTVAEAELESGLELFAGSDADVIYVVDSFGSMYGEQARGYVSKYLGFVKENGKEVGMHAHNNQQLAFANTIEAIIAGANMVDGSLSGLGRGAGNCPTELLAGFLHNPKYKMRPLLECIQNDIMPMRSQMKWGPDIPYMLCGQMNQHPRSAMRWNEGDQADDIVGFFDQITAEE
jgi:4-hydroxy 2-oxovalerate aldolase